MSSSEPNIGRLGNVGQCGFFEVSAQLVSAATTLVSPKQPSSRSRRDWYPYYAGFTEAFAESVLAEHLHDASLVLDPWSGSGTTTAACAKRGVTSKGVDLNPALTVIARARLTPLSTRDSLLPLGTRILETARGLGSGPNTGDLLERWMRADAVGRVRSIQDAIHVLLTNRDRRTGHENISTEADSLPLLASFFYSALFATVRDLLRRFRTTNPMWLKSADSHLHRIATAWGTLSEVFLERIRYLGDRLSLDRELNASDGAPFQTASATCLPFATGLYSAVLTSPPYATRIDYVRGTLPELAVLGADDAFLSALRRETTGSPVVADGGGNQAEPLASEYGLSILEQIGIHPSKGSRGYYFPWMHGYLVSLQAGLSETCRTVDLGGTICIVVQDNYYKELRIDLQRIVTEILGSLGRALVDRRDYPATNLRSRMNPRAKRHVLKRHNTESLLVFK